MFVFGWLLGTCIESFLFQCFTDSQIVQLVVTRSMVWCTVLLVLLVVTKFCFPGYFIIRIFCAACCKQDVEDFADILFESEHNDNDKDNTLFQGGFVDGLETETPCSSCQEADHQEDCKVRSSSLSRHHENQQHEQQEGTRIIEVPLLLVDQTKEGLPPPRRSCTCIVLELMGVGFVFGMVTVAIVLANMEPVAIHPEYYGSS